MKIEVRQCEVGPTTFALEKREVVSGSGVFEEFTVERSPLPPDGSDHFPIYVTSDGESISPEDFIDAMVSGNAELVTEIQEANETVCRVTGAAKLSQRESDRYVRPLGIWSRLERNRMIDETIRAVGLDPADDFVSPPGDRAFLTAQEVAKIFRVDEETVRRWSGKQLPAALRVGKKYLFRSEGIIRLLNSGPRDVPAPRARSTA